MECFRTNATKSKKAIAPCKEIVRRRVGEIQGAI